MLPFGPRTLFRYRYKRNEKLSYAALVTVTQSVRAGGATTSTTGAARILITQTLERFTNDSEFVLRETLFTSAKSGLLERLPETVTTLVTLRPSGRIHESERDRLIDFPEFAVTAIGPGETWTTDRRIIAIEPTDHVRITYRLEALDTIIPGYDAPVAAVRIGYSGTTRERGVVTTISRDSTGKMWFDTKAGRLVRQSMILINEVTAPGGVSGTSRQEIDLMLR